MPDFFNFADFNAGNAANAGSGAANSQDGGGSHTKKPKKAKKPQQAPKVISETQVFKVYRGVDNRKYIKVLGEHIYLTKKR